MRIVSALCHFCENHGPRVVMTCQPLLDNETTCSSSSPRHDASANLEEEPRCPACELCESTDELSSVDPRQSSSLVYRSTQVLPFPRV